MAVQIVGMGMPVREPQLFLAAFQFLDGLVHILRREQRGSEETPGVFADEFRHGVIGFFREIDGFLFRKFLRKRRSRHDSGIDPVAVQQGDAPFAEVRQFVDDGIGVGDAGEIRQNVLTHFQDFGRRIISRHADLFRQKVHHFRQIVVKLAVDLFHDFLLMVKRF